MERLCLTELEDDAIGDKRANVAHMKDGYAYVQRRTCTQATRTKVPEIGIVVRREEQGGQELRYGEVL